MPYLDERPLQCLTPVHWARIEGVVSELYDIVVLPNRKNSAVIGFRSDEIRRVISIDDAD